MAYSKMGDSGLTDVRRSFNSAALTQAALVPLLYFCATFVQATCWLAPMPSLNGAIDLNKCTFHAAYKPACCATAGTP